MRIIRSWCLQRSDTVFLNVLQINHTYYLKFSTRLKWGFVWYMYFLSELWRHTSSWQDYLIKKNFKKVLVTFSLQSIQIIEHNPELYIRDFLLITRTWYCKLIKQNQTKIKGENKTISLKLYHNYEHLNSYFNRFMQINIYIYDNSVKYSDCVIIS